MKSIKVCEYSRSMSFHDDLILQDQASGERSQDHRSSGIITFQFSFSPPWFKSGNFVSLITQFPDQCLLLPFDKFNKFPVCVCLWLLIAPAHMYFFFVLLFCVNSDKMIAGIHEFMI